MSHDEAVIECFDCCIQLVRSYGPDTLQQKDREALIAAMEHYKLAAVNNIRKILDATSQHPTNN